MEYKNIHRYLLVTIVSFSVSCQSDKTERVLGASVTSSNAKPATFEKIAPLTTNALGARKNLDEKGWYFIPPGTQSVEQAFETGSMSSKVAKAVIFSKMKTRVVDLPSSISQTIGEINDSGVSFRKSGTDLSEEMLDVTFKVSRAEWELSKELNGKAAKRFIYGYISLGDRLEEDTNQLIKAYNSINDARSNFSGRVNGFFVDTMWKNKNKLSNAWQNSFRKSVKKFISEYEESGQRDNTIVAMWDIFQGYTIAFKEILLSPLFDTTTAVGETLVVGGVYAPVAHVTTFSGQALVTTGMVVYYPTKVGYRILSPSLEAGLLGTMGIATMSTVAPTAVTGTGVAAFNQVTTMSTGYTGEAVTQVGGVTYESTAFVTGLVYDFGQGLADSSVYVMESGLILSYTALTVIPAHLLLTVPDGTIFLAYDGPRLVIAVVRGNYAGFDDLPTGTIIDLKEAKKAGKVEILSNDPALVKKVMEAEIKGQEKQKTPNQGNKTK
ncbi:MAG: hypothetical protein O9264_15500 [Leptospira sp.]|nr:hypothetical protein [Leptospira sp.]